MASSRLICVLMLVLGSLLGPLHATAQDSAGEPTEEASSTAAEIVAAQDISGWIPVDPGAAVEVVLPEPPEDYVTEVREGVEWTYPAAATSLVRELAGHRSEAWERVVDDFGGAIDDRVVIRVGLDPEAMRDLAPVGHPPPDYAAGVAYPRFGVILLTLQAPDSWQMPDLDKVLAHELSHIALFRAVNGQRLPRWFVEGVAVQQAGENDLNRIKTLWSAVVAGNVVPLSELDAHFPSHSHQVSIAYAQSADIIAHMRRGDTEARRFRALLRKIREEGMTFEDAFFDAYEMSLRTMESEWRTRLEERFQTVPLIVTGGGLWVLASLLLVLAYIRRRRRHHRVMAVWDAQEKADAASIERAEEAVLSELATRKAAEGVSHIVIVNGEPPQGREVGVPTVEHDGRDHTLH